ncbi:glucosaminidase domain-containing protein [Flammeovirga sp. MY04]|uniref:glycoside hydrolase family 73 protein n=1 Tax=Flammeovirga sp. MY04 TaxID=1191459 RepID=UPI0008061723|nr:glucosaminidase domain-containing protein [Flammeovirga sp. MY04]ANQ50619.1 glucosaminidase domain-containing protein [Flammeovirga sp. MY04]
MFLLKTTSELSVQSKNGLAFGLKYPNNFYFRINGNIYTVIVNPKFVLSLIVLFAGIFLVQLLRQPVDKVIYVQAPVAVNYGAQQQPTIDQFIEDFDLETLPSTPSDVQETSVVPVQFVNNNYADYKTAKLDKANTTIDKFIIERQLIVTDFLIEHKVSRVDQLSNQKLLVLNKEINDKFRKLVLDQMSVPPHVYAFFTSTVPLQKVETALMEQAKYHVPASITLAQAALETGYGKRVVGNNYFGVKDKSKKTKPITTTEYYTLEEYKMNKNIVVSSSKIKKGGRVLYKCTVKDSFAQYQTPWESFRAHSVFLNKQKRYAPLFTQGRDYKAWANMIGSTKYGGVGYATSPLYGELLKKIIQRYHLYLLDY